MTDDDRRRDDGGDRGSLLYGELLPRASTALDETPGRGAELSSVYDLAAARGKLLYKRFCSSPISNEFMVWNCHSQALPRRGAAFVLGSGGARRLRRPCDEAEPSSSIEVTSADRTLIVEHGNLMRTDGRRPSIVMLETEVPADTFGEFSLLLDACKEGCGRVADVSRLTKSMAPTGAALSVPAVGGESVVR